MMFSQLCGFLLHHRIVFYYIVMIIINMDKDTSQHFLCSTEEVLISVWVLLAFISTDIFPENTGKEHDFLY